MTKTIAQREQFDGIETMYGGEVATTAVAESAKAIVQARFIVAMQRPRNWETVLTRLLLDCKRPTFAAVAMYHKPIGRGVEGPSIRFVEAALRAMGNVDQTGPVLVDDDEKRIVEIRVIDLENNTSFSRTITIPKTVERRKLRAKQKAISSRINSSGEMVYKVEATDDDMLTQQAALESKAIRTCGLRLVPGDIVEACMDAVRGVRANQAAKDPDAAKRAMLLGYAELGVEPGELVELVGKPLEQLRPDEVEQLRGIYAALRDGETDWGEVEAFFQPQRTPDGQVDPKAKPRTLGELASKLSAKQEVAPVTPADTAKDPNRKDKSKK